MLPLRADKPSVHWIESVTYTAGAARPHSAVGSPAGTFANRRTLPGNQGVASVPCIQPRGESVRVVRGVVKARRISTGINEYSPLSAPSFS